MSGRRKRRAARAEAPSEFRMQHGGVAFVRKDGDAGAVHVNEAESPLAWLARRKGPDGRQWSFSGHARLMPGRRTRLRP